MPRTIADRFRAARMRPDEVVLEGFHVLKHALRFGADVRAIATSDPAALEGLAATLAPDLACGLREHATAVDAVTLAALAPRAPGALVVAVAGRPQADVVAALAGAGPVVLLEDPRHAGNLGAAVRVAAAAGAAAVLTTGSRDPWEPAALRGAAGLHFALPVARVGDVPAGDRPLVALDPGGEPLRRHALPPRPLLAFGTERHGLSDELLGRAVARVAIPMRPGVSSLNLATAVAVALYALQDG